jgi:acid phosphatase family membrane protein YuiD
MTPSPHSARSTALSRFLTVHIPSGLDTERTLAVGHAVLTFTRVVAVRMNLMTEVRRL